MRRTGRVRHHLAGRERGEIRHEVVSERERPILEVGVDPCIRRAVQHPVGRDKRPLRRGEVECLVRAEALNRESRRAHRMRDPRKMRDRRIRRNLRLGVVVLSAGLALRRRTTEHAEHERTADFVRAARVPVSPADVVRVARVAFDLRHVVGGRATRVIAAIAADTRLVTSPNGHCKKHGNDHPLLEARQTTPLFQKR